MSIAAPRADGRTAAAVTPVRCGAMAVVFPETRGAYAFAGYCSVMERGSDKVSPRRDEQRKHETEGLVRSGHSTHAEEWKDPEPVGEDQPDTDLAPDGTLHGGTPTGMAADDVDGRS